MGRTLASAKQGVELDQGASTESVANAAPCWLDSSSRGDHARHGGDVGAEVTASAPGCVGFKVCCRARIGEASRLASSCDELHRASTQEPLRGQATSTLLPPPDGRSSLGEPRSQTPRRGRRARVSAVVIVRLRLLRLERKRRLTKSPETYSQRHGEALGGTPQQGRFDLDDSRMGLLLSP